MVMGIDPIKKRMMQIQAIQAIQNNGESSKAQSSQQAGGASGSSLLDKLNGLDNKLNQGGGVSLSNSASGQAGGIEELLKKKKKA